jgi:hypothetical protein
MRTARLPLVLVLALALAAVAVAAPAAALAQSAGDDQYVDPFQNDNGSGNGGGDNSGSQGGGGGGEVTTDPAPSTEIPEATAQDPVPTEPVTPSATAASDGEALPRTGLPALALAAIGTFLLGGGAALRRRA